MNILTGLDWTPVFQAIILGLATLVTGILALIGWAARNWLISKGLVTEQQANQASAAAYTSRLLKGISFAETKLGKDAGKLKPGDLDEFAKTAAQYVRDSWPDMVKDAGLQLSDIAKHVMSRMPSETSAQSQASDQAALATTSTSIAVTPAPASGKG